MFRSYAVPLLLLLVAGSVRGEVFSSEFFSDPISEGWELVEQYCDPETWLDNGWYFQQLDNDPCPPPPNGGKDSYVRWITDYNGEPEFFLELRVLTDGDNSEILGGAPVGLSLFNFFGINYHLTIARDRVRFLRDVELPIYYFDIQAGVPHTYRIELYPDWYIFYIDTWLADEGVPEGPFPSEDARFTWRGKSWYLPCQNAWDYIRYGAMPEPGSGDYDGDGLVGASDFYYFQDYFSGSNHPALPGGAFADFDFDGDIDCDDWEAFRLAWTDPGDPPPLGPCDLNPIPAVSDWGVVLMTLLLLTAGTILFRRVPPLSV
jgi:hypothetical protein